MKILYCEPQELLAPNSSSSVSLLTDSSLTRNGHVLFLPPHHERWTLTVAPALHISRLGKFIATKFAHRYYDAWTLTARLRPDGITYPASATEVAFDSSMITGEWMPLDPTDKTEIEVNITGTTEFILKLDLKYFNETISGLSGSFIMKHGDVIVPRPQLVAFPVIPDTKLELACDGKQCLSFKIK